MQKNKNYKWCIVPLCKNTSITTPEKCFIQVPKNDLKRRKLWIRRVRREPKEFSLVSTIYVCEDHFDLETDMENFVKWKMVGGPKIIKKEVVPHKFECQNHMNLTTMDVPSQKGAEESKRLNEVQKVLDSSAKKPNLSPNSSIVLEVEEDKPGSWSFIKQEHTMAQNDLKNEDANIEIKNELLEYSHHQNEPHTLGAADGNEGTEIFIKEEIIPQEEADIMSIKTETVEIPTEDILNNDNDSSHTTNNTENITFNCDFCGYTATDRSSLSTHEEECKSFVLKSSKISNLIKDISNNTLSYDSAETTNVQYLKTIKFSSLPLEEQIRIKSVGRPKPNLLITNVTKCKSRDYKRTFKKETYEKTDWLCGCDVSNSLYCFPCLLFESDEASEWTKSGVKDLVHLSEKIKKHQHSKSHLSAKLGFNLLGKQNIRQQLNSAYRLSIEKHNEQVKNNRYVLTKIINCIKFCGAFELALRGHDEQEDSLNPSIFRGLINFSGELDLALRDHLQQATVFKGTSKDIQNDLLECMLSVCQAHIKKEIAASNFVSVISEEISDISNIFQMVIVYRYTLTNGTPVERFWSFMKPNEHDAITLARCIEESLNFVLKNPYQLISQSYDGASVMSGSHGSVQKLIKDKFKYAHYIHCYAHQLNLIISQATSINTNVRIFFSDLSDITNFFSNSPERVAILDEVVGNRVPRASAPMWNFKMRTVNCNIVYENREALIECMEKIRSTSRQSNTIRKAGALLRLLHDTKFVFWLTVFHRVMPHVDLLYSQLQRRATDNISIKRCISEFEKNIQKEKDNMHTIRETDLVDIDECQATKRRKTDETNSYISTTMQAKEVCDTIIAEIKRRFSFTGHLEIAQLFLVENFETYFSNFSIIQLDSAIRNFPFLNKNKLKTELEIIYRREDFREVSGAVHLLKFLIENNLQTDFSETFLVLQAIVTMPMTTVETERCFSTLNRIKTFLRSTMSQNRLTALAMLSIEKQMIQEIPNFNELVIEEFISQKDRHLHFQYKSCL